MNVPISRKGICLQPENKKGSDIRKIRIHALTLSLLSIFFAAIAYGSAGGNEILSTDERVWLTQNQPRLVLAVETGYAPFVFIDSKDQPTGLAHDYIRLIESKLGVHFNQKRFLSLDEIFQKVRSGEVHIVNAVTSTPARTKFLSMTTPFISVPNVIIVRKEHSDPMSESDLTGLKISLVKSYAITEYMTNRGLQFIPDIVPDDLSSLLNVSFGRTDAAIIDLATASYLISEKGIANLRVAGEVAYDVRLSMATHLDDTRLNGILQKGLNAITEPERLEIKERWINAVKPQSVFKDRQFWMVLVSVVAAALVILTVILAWNRTLRQQITLRKSAEESFKAAFQYSRSLIEASLDPLVVISAEGKITDANTATEKATGVSRDALIGSEFVSYFTDPTKACEVYREAFSRGSVIDYALSIRHAPGRSVDVLYNASVYKDVEGKVLGVFAAARDVTERTLSEVAIRQSSEEQTAIFESATSGIAFIKNRVIVKGNHTLDYLFGYEPGEQAGLTTRHWYVDDEAYEVGGTPYAILARGETHQRKQELVRKDGTKFWCHFSGSAIEVGNLSRGTVWMLTDVTHEHDTAEALRLAKDAAEAANRAKSEFLANMSHEIRTPLNGVLGMNGLLLGTDLNSEQRRYAQTIRSSGDTLLTLLNDILDFSKIEAGLLELETLKFSLPDMLEDFAGMVALRAHGKGLAFGCVVAPEVPTQLLGDPGRLRQILTNLTGNALKFTDKGEVVVRVRLLEEMAETVQLRFSVCDTGIGIPADKRAKLFQKFSQVDASTTRLYGGTGLGLAISKQLAALMGGEVGVESVRGQGSEFWFTVRLGKTPSHIKRTAAPSPAELRDVRVLIVDPYPVNREILVGLMDSWGLRVANVPDGPSALHALAEAHALQDPFVIAMLDLQLPSMDGNALGRAIKDHPDLHATRLVRLTTLGQSDRDPDWEANGFVATLTKPVRRGELQEVLAAVMCGRKVAPGRTELPADFADAGLPPARILVVEDNTVNQLVAVGILTKLGLSADVAANGLEAIEALAMLPYDLVLMDMQMPELDGVAATRQIRDPQSRVLDHRVTVIAMTANAMQADRDLCLAAGMDDYITKPVEFPALIAALEKWLKPNPNKEVPTQMAGNFPTGVHAPDHSAADPARNLPAATPHKEPPVFDRVGLLHRVMQDKALAQLVITSFLKDLPSQIRQLNAFVTAGEAHQIGEQAHQIKGACAAVSGEALRALAAVLEAAGKAGDMETITARMPEVYPQFAALKEALEQTLREPS